MRTVHEAWGLCSADGREQGAVQVSELPHQGGRPRERGRDVGRSDARTRHDVLQNGQRVSRALFVRW